MGEVGQCRPGSYELSDGGPSGEVVEIAQVKDEFDQLYDLFLEFDPANVLEIGTWHGGTLWYWLQGPRSVVAIDEQMLHPRDFQQWAKKAGSRLTLIHDSSRELSARLLAADLGPYQFCFIDGDHTYEGVKFDWETYSPMVDKGGIVAFHDIAERAGYGVSRLWGELRDHYETREIWEGIPGYCGIGVLWK